MAHKPRQCRSCGGSCGGGYTMKSGRYKPCRNTAHLDYPVHLEAQRVAKQVELLMKEGRSLLESLAIVAKAKN